jgi:hypothetical protein
VEIFDSRNAGSGENQLGHLGVGLDGWVRTRSRRVKICIGSATAGAVRERGLQRTATFLKLSIEVGVERDAHLLCCGQIAFDEGARRQMAFDPKGTARAVIAIGKGLMPSAAKSRKPRTMMVKLPGSGGRMSNPFTSCVLSSETWTNDGMLPRGWHLHDGFGRAKMRLWKHAELY